VGHEEPFNWFELHTAAWELDLKSYYLKSRQGQ